MRNWRSLSSLTAGTTILLAMVDRVKGKGRAPLTPPGWADFTITMECTPETSHCHSVCTLWAKHCMHRLSIVYALSSVKHAALPFPLFCSNTTGKKGSKSFPPEPKHAGEFCLPYTACKPQRMRVFAAHSFFQKLSKVCWHCAAMGSPSCVAGGELLSWNKSKYRTPQFFTVVVLGSTPPTPLLTN